MIDTPYTDHDMIREIYLNPANEVLLAEYILQTGAGSQLGGIAGAGDSTIGITEIQGQGGGNDGGGRCFIGRTFAVLANRRARTFKHLYLNRHIFIGQYAKAFDKDNNIVAGEILDIFKSKAYQLLEVQFDGEPYPMYFKPKHRFWTLDKTFVSMCDLKVGDKTFSHRKTWNSSIIKSMRLIDCPRGIDVYNMTVKDYHSYFAYAAGGEPKAVSNAKPRGDIIE